MIYLDWAATAIPKCSIIEKNLKKSLLNFGNPSATHNLGLKAKEILENSRKSCASILKCSPESLYFTSGGTESNNIALLSFLKKHSSGQIITTSIEHPSIIEPLNILKKYGWKVKNINPALDGIIPINKIIKNISDKTKIISIIYVHNETGVIQPISEIVNAIREKEKETGKKIHIHFDGVQAVGKLKINLDALGIDSFSISGHKFGAPKGIGLLYLRGNKEVIYRGGGQEKGIRPGTENLMGILSLTDCLVESTKTFDSRLEELNILMNELIQGSKEIGLTIIPKTRKLSDEKFVPNIISLTSTPIPGEVIARVLSDKGFMVSTGSACSNNKKSTTKGILSMGITEKEGFSSFRVSIGYSTTRNDIDQFLISLKDVINELNP